VIVVADATPLIALAKIEQIALLRRLFGEICIPQAVYGVSGCVTSGR
jgi:predicted nucleic acid-binding protein